MNLGDGLKLETELLDGKTKLILSPYEHKSKFSVKMGNKTKIAKCPLRTKQTGHIIKSQNTCIGSGKLFQKKTIDSGTSQARGEKNRMILSPTKDLCKKYTDKDCLCSPKEISSTTPNIQKNRNTIDISLVDKQKSHKKHITVENMNSGLVCLTQDQLQQILMIVNQENGSVSLTENGKEEETSQDSLHLNNIPSQPKDKNIMGLLQKYEAVSSIPDENKSVLNKNQEAPKQYEQKIALENEWKPGDIFSTLGERERDRSLLEAKKAQWKKELDEQVALKKKEKEASEKWSNSWKKSESDKIMWEKLQILDQSKEAMLLEHPFGAVKQEQRKWIEELNKQVEDDQQRKTEEKIIFSKGEEHDRWAMHFDSLKSHPGSQSQLSSRSTQKQPEYFCVSPDTQELADVSSVYTPTTGSQFETSEEEHIAKPLRDVAEANNQKTNFLRSMTALLDPAQIEERDRRRQKQLEHQKAITAQVEEKRRKKQLEEEQRKKEEQEEEHRLAREREEMQKQYEEDILKQKKKEEIMTLKTNELFQTMQRAQELAHRLKQEQRIRELAQKGHDTSRLMKNLGVDTIQMDYNASINISNSRHDSEEASGKMNSCINSTTSPRKDTGVQTDDLTTGIFANAESYCEYVKEREITNCSSPEISVELNGQFKTDKQELSKKNANLEKENSLCNEFIKPEKQTKHMKRCPRRPEWNLNKPLKRGTSSEVHSSQQETESQSRWHLVKKEEESHSLNKERFQSSPIPAVKNRTQQTQTNNTSHLPLEYSSCETENLISRGGQTGLSAGMSESSHFIPYVRTNEIYYLDPDAPLSRPSTQEPQYQNSQDCDQVSDHHIRDPLLNPNLLKNRDRQQAILKGLSELRQGLLQKQKELETNFMPLAANQEENFSSSF
ncbi:coiled-coil domain-containing protein 66 isoform X4 [Marmota marmota marmota]|uniref:coiled-coil domain-containing protein 66 isoform X4 n=1 Tax=Marmota marmota marmota TaxID=9994 RepID=UPI002091FC63|nr:coiled-coil domain-containing protein 66 isoform X4 [Marmota marmota marmota]